MAHLRPSHRVAAGLHLPASPDTSAFAATQAAWRFYANPRLSLPQLACPLIDRARAGVQGQCGDYALVIYDFCLLHYTRHSSKTDRVELAHGKDPGYELLTALAVSDQDGSPVAPLCIELRGADGVHSTRFDHTIPARSSLDRIEPIMAHVADQLSGRRIVSVIDREADSVAHYRRWDKAGHKFLVRAKGNRVVLHEGEPRKLKQIAQLLKDRGQLEQSEPISFKHRHARQLVGHTSVVLHRAARPHRADRRGRGRRRKRRPVAGAAITLRLVVAEVRQVGTGKVLARWFLLSNLPGQVEAPRVALWYYWRWRIESYHKLLKGAGQEVECWQQETAEALARRMVVSAMACVVVWQLARQDTPRAQQMREVLVRLSGRQLNAQAKSRGYTEPALLAGLGVLIPMLELLEHNNVNELRQLASDVLPLLAQRCRAGPAG